MVTDGAMRRSRERHLRVAAALLLIQGVLMELAVFVGLLILLVLQVPEAAVTARVEIFAFDELNDHLYLMMAMSGVFGALRIIGAVGVLRNRLWAFALSLIMCATTLILMIFMLPAGLLDGVLTGTAVVLLLRAWIGPARPLLTDP